MGKNFDIDMNLNGKKDTASAMVSSFTQKLRALKAEQRGEKPLAKFLMAGGDKQSEILLQLLGGAKFGMGALIAEGIGKSFEGVGNFVGDIVEGKKNWKEMTDEMVRGVPILGPLYSGFRSIRDAITGEAAAAKELLKITEEQEQHEKRRAEATAFNLKQMQDSKNFARQAELEILQSYGGGLAVKAAKQEADDKLAERQEEAQRQRDEAGKLLVGGEKKAAIERANKMEEDAKRVHAARMAQIDLEAGQRTSDAETASMAAADAAQSRINQQKARLDDKQMDADIEAAKQAGRERQKAITDQAIALARSGLSTPATEVNYQNQLRTNEQETQTQILQIKKDASERVYATAQEAYAKQAVLDNRHLDADLIRIRTDYKEKIRVARTEEERLALAKQEAADESLARNADKKKNLQYDIEDLKDAGRVTRGLSSEFLGLGEARQYQIDDALKYASRQADNSDTQVKILQDLLRALQDRKTITLKG